MDEKIISIRTATKEDAEMIADVSRATFYDTFASQNTAKNMELFLSEQFTKQRLISEVGVEENTFLLAYLNEDLCGYVKLRLGERPDAIKEWSALEIARIYVCKQFIGLGVGKCLMQAAIDVAKKKKLQVVWLAVWEHNERAYSFYSSWGFEVFGSQIFLLGYDVQKDWLMKKTVDENQ